MRIVVVEDDAVSRDAIVESLDEEGFAVAGVDGPEGFLPLLEQAPVDVLMVDVYLGAGPSGFELAERARGRWPAVVIVYITGDLRAVVRTSGQRDLCLLKPFTEQALRSLMRSIPRVAAGPEA